MLLNSVRCKVARLFLTAAVLVVLIGVPSAPSVFAGDCSTAAAGSSC